MNVNKRDLLNKKQFELEIDPILEDDYDVTVKLIHRPRYGVSAALDMTRTDARYGPMLSGVFTDRNVSGKGDMLEFKVLKEGLTMGIQFSK